MAATDETAAPAEQAPVAAVDQQRLAAAQPEQWLTYGGSYDENRHSTLTKINRDTLPDLGIGWLQT